MLFNHINGTPAPPSTVINTITSQSNPNSEYLKWLQEDQLLLSWILSSLTKEIFPYVTGLDFAIKACTSLSKAFGISNSQLHITLQNTLGDKPLAQFLREAKAITDELVTAGTRVS